MQSQGLRAQVRSPKAGLIVVPSVIICAVFNGFPNYTETLFPQHKMKP